MYETLSQHAIKEKEEAHIPPIITMTTVGKEVRLWIGYVGPDKEPGAAQKQDKHRNVGSSSYQIKFLIKAYRILVEDALTPFCIL